MKLNAKLFAALGGASLTAGVLALLVPLNMGGCGSDAGSAINNLGAAAGGQLNSIHTGTPVDRVGVGDTVKAGGQALRAITLGDRDEENLGRDVALRVTNQFGVVDDDALNRYVTSVGLAVADASPRTDYPYCFCVLNSDEVNAFSGPGGFVMITRGALAQMRDESELAGVLGHEIGHVVKQHGLAAVKRANRNAALGTALKTQEFYNQFGQFSDMATDLVLNVPWSQAEESEADAEAVRYVAGAGYDPQGYLHFLQRVQAEGRAGGQGGGKLFPTHPGIADRVKHVSDQIAREGTAGKGQANADRFAANVKLR